MSQTHFMNKQNATDILTAYANKIKAIINGHVIKNASGTSITQRSTLQFDGYLKAEDDSTNEITTVSDAPTEVAWSTWVSMTEQEKAGTHWIITNVPEPQSGKTAVLLTLDEYNALPAAQKQNTSLIYYCYVPEV